MNQAAMMRLKKLQQQMQEAQAKLEQEVFCGTAGGGMVTVEMKGTKEVLKVTIDKDAFESKDDIEMIEDSIVAAISDASKKVDDETAKVMGPFTAGLPRGMF